MHESCPFFIYVLIMHQPVFAFRDLQAILSYLYYSSVFNSFFNRLTNPSISDSVVSQLVIRLYSEVFSFQG